MKYFTCKAKGEEANSFFAAYQTGFLKRKFLNGTVSRCILMGLLMIMDGFASAQPSMIMIVKGKLLLTFCYLTLILLQIGHTVLFYVNQQKLRNPDYCMAAIRRSSPYLGENADSVYVLNLGVELPKELPGSAELDFPMLKHSKYLTEEILHESRIFQMLVHRSGRMPLGPTAFYDQELYYLATLELIEEQIRNDNLDFFTKENPFEYIV